MAAIKRQTVNIRSGNLKLSISGRRLTQKTKADALKLAKEISANRAKKLKK